MTVTPTPPQRRPPMHLPPAFAGAWWNDVFGDRAPGGRFRAARRLLGAMIWTLLCIPVQMLLIALPDGGGKGAQGSAVRGWGRGKVRFARFYHQGLCFCLGLKVQVVGKPANASKPGLPVLFISNHSSWLDILVLGSQLEACFVSKAEVGGWPLIGLVARLGRTVFVSRDRQRTGREANEISAKLSSGDSLILFPEGTSSDGNRVLPFRSSFLAASAQAQLIQPVTLVYDRLDGFHARRRDRPVFAWYGGMDIASHAWRFATHNGARATLVMHEPFAPAALPNRKDQTRVLEQLITETAATLRQNRAVEPGSVFPKETALPKG